MAKDRFVEIYSQGMTNVEKIIVDRETGVNYLLASSALTVGCGMSVLVDQDGKPVITAVDPLK
ncbi:MAG: xylan 1,4-beta-xylosidase [Lachnospiraceae bacterium]|nr:xylan 1,4-beta-xylosidase [Lachnospiraceae bacterium]